MSEKKKILLVSNGFFPEISPRSFRATELAKEFIRQGHEVTVFSKCRDYDYSDFLDKFPVTLRMWSKGRFPDIQYSNSKRFSSLSRGLSRLLLVLFEYPGIEELFKVKKMLRNEKEYDLMISFAVPYPIHWGVGWARRKNYRIAKVWVADCGDPYMGDVLDSFRKMFYFRFLEKGFCRRCDYISIPTDDSRPGYYHEFQSKIRIIPQGFEFDLNKKISGYSGNIESTFAYAGGFHPGIRDPRPLLDFLIQVNLPFKFFIYTDKTDLLSDYQKILESKLRVSGYVPRNELMKILAEMDFLINFDNNTTLNTPSKLIDYSIANRPVLNIKRDIIEEDIIAFLNGDYSRRIQLPEPERYHIKNVSKQFLDLL